MYFGKFRNYVNNELTCDQVSNYDEKFGDAFRFVAFNAARTKRHGNNDHEDAISNQSNRRKQLKENKQYV